MVAETKRGFDRLGDAVASIGDSDGTIQIAPGRYGDCAVQSAGRVTFIAREPGTVTFDGGVCEGKATLVLRGRGTIVRGLRFTHATVPEGNGAGIRLERSDLSVSNTEFIDAQSGILTANDPSSSITIDHSTFADLGKDPWVPVRRWGFTAAALAVAVGGAVVYQHQSRHELLCTGAEQKLEFITQAPPLPLQAPVAFTAVVISLESGEEQGLVVRERALPNRDPFTKGDIVMRDPAVTSLAFKFQNDDGEWGDTWDGQDQKAIPRAISLTIGTTLNGKAQKLPRAMAGFALTAAGIR